RQRRRALRVPEISRSDSVGSRLRPGRLDVRRQRWWARARVTEPNNGLPVATHVDGLSVAPRTWPAWGALCAGEQAADVMVCVVRVVGLDGVPAAGPIQLRERGRHRWSHRQVQVGSVVPGTV